MAENFLDNIVYAGSTLGISGDAIAIGSTNAGAKSIIFNTSNTAGHLAWLPTAARTINLPDAAGTVMLTSQAILSLSAGATRITSGEVVFSNSNGVSFGINGQTVTGSVAAQTNQTVGLFGIGNTTQNSSTTLDARTLSFNGLGAATVGFSNGSIQFSVPVQTAQTQSNVQGISAGTQVGRTGDIIFSNSNGISFGMNGSNTITASYTVPTQTNQTVGLYAVSNTTQNSSTTLDARTISFQGAGIASVGYSNGSVIVSVPSAAPAPVNFSAGTTSGNLGSVVFADGNGVTFGLNGSTITASAAGGGGGGTLSLFALGNTTQNSSSSLDARSVSFNALGAMTMGYSNGSIQVSAPPTSSLSATGAVSISTNGSTISIGVSNLGTMYDYEPFPYMSTGSTNFSGNTGSSGGASFFPFALPGYVAAQHINVVQSMTFVTLGNSSGRQTMTQAWGLYTRGTGTNSSTIGTITSGSFSIGITGNNSSYTINQPTTSNATGYGTNTTSSAGVNISSGYTGFKLIQLQINSTLSPGNYWLALFNAISTSSINVGISVSYVGNGRVTALNAIAPIGSFSSAFSAGAASGNNNIGGWYLGMGSFTSAAQTNLPASVALTAISFSASNVVSVYPHFKLVGTI